VRLRRPIRLDKEELEELAGVTFSGNDVAELAELATIYAERFRGPPVPDFILADLPKPTARTARAAELAARRAFVEAVEGVWRECRSRRGRGSSYRQKEGTGVHDGPLLRLLRNLFAAIDEQNTPSAATLHHDLDFLHTGRERTRSGKRKRGCGSP